MDASSLLAFIRRFLISTPRLRKLVTFGYIGQSRSLGPHLLAKRGQVALARLLGLPYGPTIPLPSARGFTSPSRVQAQA